MGTHPGQITIPWTDAQVRTALRLRAEGRQLRDIAAEIPGRSVKAVEQMFGRIRKGTIPVPAGCAYPDKGIHHGPGVGWSEAEVLSLREMWAAGFSVSAIGVKMGRPPDSVGSKLTALGLWGVGRTRRRVLTTTALSRRLARTPAAPPAIRERDTWDRGTHPRCVWCGEPALEGSARCRAHAGPRFVATAPDARGGVGA